MISKSSQVRLIAKDEAGITVAYANQIKYHEKMNIEAAKRLQISSVIGKLETIFP